MDHFRKLSQNNNACNESFNFDEHFLSDDTVNGNKDVLNVCFEVNEIMKIIQGLKNHKANGIDLLKMNV